MLTGYKMEAT